MKSPLIAKAPTPTKIHPDRRFAHPWRTAPATPRATWLLPAICLSAFLFLAPRLSALTYYTSYFGNSSPGASYEDNTYDPDEHIRAHVQDNFAALCVAADGTCYTNSLYDEGFTPAGIYKNGQKIGTCQHLWDNGRNGGLAVVADGNYLYVTMSESGDHGTDPNPNSNGLAQYPPANTVWYGVRRYTLNGAYAPFPAGYGPGGNILVVSQGTRPAPQPWPDPTHSAYFNYTGALLTGVAVDAGYLYVSDPAAGQVKKYSLGTFSGTPVQTWSVTQPGSLLIVGASLYAVQGGATPAVLQYSTTGTLQAKITFAAGVKPGGLGYNAATSSLMVTDRGPDQNIKQYATSGRTGTPTAVKATFGVKGGIFSGTGAQIGAAGPLRFFNPTGVGADSSGNLYVAQDGQGVLGASCGGGVLESYTGGTRNWQLYDLMFVDCADVDAASENDVYVKDSHWTMNWANTNAGTEATYAGTTINPIKYPQDMRLHLNAPIKDAAFNPPVVYNPLGDVAEAKVRTIQGRKFLVVGDQYSTYLGIFRFNTATDGGCAVPSVMFSPGHVTTDTSGWPANQPASGEWIWRDANGNGGMDGGEYVQSGTGANAPAAQAWWMDSNGDVWQATQTAGLRHFACQGFDSAGNPLYDYGHLTVTPMPAPFNDVERMIYLPATDTMYLSGFSNAAPNTNGTWGNCGTILCRYDHWSNNPALHVNYPLALPLDGSGNPLVHSVDAAGSYVFAACFLPNEVDVYNAETTASMGAFYPDSNVGGNGGSGQYVLGGIDVPYGIHAYERASGEYVVFVEENQWGKMVMYRWTPLIQLQNRWQGTYLNTENGLQCTNIYPIWWSADWIQQPAGGGNFYLLNRHTNQYLTYASGGLQCTNITPGATAAQWYLGSIDGTYDDILNASNGYGINIENGLTCGPIIPGWYSAMWNFQKIDY